jgi:hypothetical protein
MPHMITINRCSHEYHAELKRDRGRFVTATVFRGWQEDRDLPAFELRNCKRCQSSLSDGTRRAVIDVTEVARVA